jgi:hypothetical protein
LLAGLAAGCDSAPSQPESSDQKAPRLVSASILGCAGSTVQIRQVFAANTRWVSSLGAGDKYWDRDSENMFSCGDYQFEDFMLIVPAGRSASIELWGGECHYDDEEEYTGPKLYDPYLYLFDFTTKELIDSDDDGGCGFNSYLIADNSEGSTARRYFIRATEYDPEYRGQYMLVIYVPARDATDNPPF